MYIFESFSVLQDALKGTPDGGVLQALIEASGKRK